MNITMVDAEPWYFTMVYASPDPNKRKDLWLELQNFATTHNKPQLIAGDFNETRVAQEISSVCAKTLRRAQKFNTWIEDMQLFELEFVGASHTWLVDSLMKPITMQD